MMLPEMRILAREDISYSNNIGAREHTAKNIVAYLNDNVLEFIEPENCPPNSPDLNLVDYSIWENVSQRVYKHLRIRDVQHLKDLWRE